MHRKSGGDEIRRKGNDSAFEYGRFHILCRSTPESSRSSECDEAAG